MDFYEMIMTDYNDTGKQYSYRVGEYMYMNVRDFVGCEEYTVDDAIDALLEIPDMCEITGEEMKSRFETLMKNGDLTDREITACQEIMELTRDSDIVLYC